MRREVNGEGDFILVKTLQQVLAQCTKEQLEQIARLWGMSDVPQKGTRQFYDKLLQYGRDSIAARFVWEYLSPTERIVFYRVLSPPNRYGIRRDSIPKKTQLSTSECETAFTKLESHALLVEEQVKMRGNQLAEYGFGNKNQPVEEVSLVFAFTENSNTLYKVGRELFLPGADRSKMTLEKILAPLYQGELYQIADRYNLDWQSFNAHVDLRSMIAEELVQPEVCSDILHQLTPETRELFKWLCDQGGKVSIQALRKHAGYDDATLFTILHTFEDYALAFDTFSENERVLFVPQEMYTNLKNAAARPKPEEVPTGLLSLVSPPQAIRPAHPFVLYDLAIIIGAMYQQSIEPTQAGKVPKRIATRIQPLLHGKPRIRYLGEDDDYMEMLFRIAKELGLIQLSKTLLGDIKQRYEPGPQLEQWSRLGLVGQTRRLLQCWSKSFSWLDVLGVNFTQWDPYSWNPMAARSAIQPYLQDCVPGRWYSVQSLLQTIWDQDSFVLRPVQYNARGIQRRKTGAMQTKWNNCDGEVFIGLLASSLYELGIVALGYQQPDPPAPEKRVNPDAFMLTELGAASLSSNVVSPPSSPVSSLSNGNRSLVIQPNFELLLLQPDLPTLYSLLPFVQVNQVDVVSRLTLTRESLLRGMDANMSIEQILQVLESYGQKEVPQNVAYTLRDWVKLYKKVTISQVFLIEVSDEALADEISTSSKLQTFGLRRLSPYIIAVNSDINLSELRRALDKEGIVTHISSNIISNQSRSAVIFGTRR